MSRRQYHFILNEIVMCAGTNRVDGRALLDFMFHTNNVTEEVAERSETLLTKLMQDNREWIWVEVDSGEDSHAPDKKVIGAMGYNPDDPYNRLIVELPTIQKRWRKKNDKDIHPLVPIIEAWLASGKDQEKANKEAARQGAQA